MAGEVQEGAGCREIWDKRRDVQWERGEKDMRRLVKSQETVHGLLTCSSTLPSHVRLGSLNPHRLPGVHPLCHLLWEMGVSTSFRSQRCRRERSCLGLTKHRRAVQCTLSSREAEDEQTEVKEQSWTSMCEPEKEEEAEADSETDDVAHP